VLRSVNAECAMQFELRFRRGRRGETFDLVYAKHNFGKFGSFQNLLMHFFVARIIVGFAAGGVRNNLSRRISGIGVNGDFTAFHGEGAVNQMQGGVERPI